MFKQSEAKQGIMNKITNQTIVTFKTFRDYYFLNLRRHRFALLFSILGAIATIMILLALGYNVLNFFLNQEPLNFKTFQPTIILASVYISYYGIIYFRINAAYRKNKAVFSQPINYVFEENRITISTSAGSSRDRSTFSYNEIIGVFQNKKYMVIAFENNRTTIVRKDAFKPEEKDIIPNRLQDLMEKMNNQTLNNE